MTEFKVCVFCGSRSGNNPAYTDAAHAVAQELASRGMQLVFGGGGTGLMGETARTALDLGVSVTGIIPTFLINQETPVENLSELLVVADMHERKAKMAELSDMFVVLPGGIGTMEEACEMITGNWIGLYNKPVGFLNVNGFSIPSLPFSKTPSTRASCLSHVTSAPLSTIRPQDCSTNSSQRVAPPNCPAMRTVLATSNAKSMASVRDKAHCAP